MRLREATSEITATLPAAVTGLPADPTASWTLPDGTRREDVASTGPFVATAGESMRAAFTELVGDRRVPGDELTFVFTLAATVATDPLPTIDVDTGTATIEHVASLSGSPLALADVSFVAHGGDGADLAWQLGDGADAQSASGTGFAPHLDLAPGTYALLLRTGDGFVRRCEVSVLDQGALVAGAASGHAIATAATSGSASCSPPTTSATSIAKAGGSPTASTPLSTADASTFPTAPWPR